MADFIVAVTGGVASGKSAVTEAFQAHGVTVCDADVAARAIVEPGQPALAAIVEAFGADSLTADGRLDRVAMRARVFSDAGAKATLEALLHPRIRTWMREACEAAAGEYALAAIPLLAEGGGRGAYPWLQRVLVVDVPEAVQQARLAARDGIAQDLARRMVAAQATRAQRLAIADDVLVNDGALADLPPIVARLDARYRALART
ncbi:dephospho-CoA kinase [Arenimonas sp. MALMAid1274]|uniref:dephospho-CoA kinase n=1 Tax=Arenimonas sp. MALMAid1274 TaxID=3411630 RepID=UPI003B9F60FF